MWFYLTQSTCIQDYALYIQCIYLYNGVQEGSIVQYIVLNTYRLCFGKTTQSLHIIPWNWRALSTFAFSFSNSFFFIIWIILILQDDNSSACNIHIINLNYWKPPCHWEVSSDNMYYNSHTCYKHVLIICKHIWWIISL